MYPYANLTDLSFLETPGYIAGVTNPVFEGNVSWWDLLVVLNLSERSAAVFSPEEKAREDAAQVEARAASFLDLAGRRVGDLVAKYGRALKDEERRSAATICLALHLRGVVPRLGDLSALCAHLGVPAPPSRVAFQEAEGNVVDGLWEVCQDGAARGGTFVMCVPKLADVCGVGGPHEVLLALQESLRLRPGADVPVEKLHVGMARVWCCVCAQDSLVAELAAVEDPQAAARALDGELEDKVGVLGGERAHNR